MNESEPDRPADAAREPDAPPTAGFGTLISESLGAFIDHFEARLELLRLEAGEARAWLLRRIIAAAVGIVSIGFGYLLLWIGLIGWIARAGGIPWFFVTLLAAALHLLVTAACWFATKRPFAGKPFEATLAELHHDRERLRRGDSSSSSE